MALSIISNMAANTAHRTLTQSDAMATRSLAKLSSGKRVMGAQDDAASMAIGARLNAEVQSLKTATTNASQANSMLQIADGALATTNSILTRMKSLAVQGASENLSRTERGFIYNEFNSLRSEVNRIAKDTEFNGSKLLQGSREYTVGTLGADINASKGFSSFKFANNTALGTASNPADLTFAYSTAGSKTLTVFKSDGTSQTITNVTSPTGGDTKDLYFSEFGLTVTLNSSFATTAIAAGAGSVLQTGSKTGNDTTFSYKVGSGGVSDEDDLEFTLQTTDAASLDNEMSKLGNFNNAADAVNAITYVGQAINKLQSARATIGVGQNRLEFAAQNLRSAQENNEASRSTLMDLDVAQEMTNFTSKTGSGSVRGGHAVPGQPDAAEPAASATVI